MDVKLAKVLKLINDLTKQELMILNQVVVSLIKTHTDVDFKKAAINFQVGDIVSFVDSSGVRVHGVILKETQKPCRLLLRTITMLTSRMLLFLLKSLYAILYRK